MPRKRIFRSIPAYTLYTILVFVIAFSLFQSTRGAQSNPGHPWTQIDEGNFAVSSTPLTAPRMYIFPNANATILSTSSTVTTAQGGTNVTSAGTSGSLLVSNGTNWEASSTQMSSFVPRPPIVTGAVTAFQMRALTTSSVQYFNLPQPMTLNMITFNVSTNGAGGTNTYKLCMYNDAKNKILDLTSPATVANAVTTTASAAYLAAGNYYFLMGCATACSSTISAWTSNAVNPVNGNSVPTSTAKRVVWEGTATRTSGACDATLGYITGAQSLSPIIRLDN